MKSFDWISQTGSFAMDLLFSSIGILLLIHPSGGLFILYVLTVILSFLIPFRLISLMCSGIRQRSRTNFCLIVFNLLFGLLPVIHTLIKRPAEILARTDVN